ncbi:MAG: hypothetical protein KA139_07245 [Rhodobacteraceae bacterium]|nr:hypothetical protein [Paracoccaceae bacterium]
MPRQVHIVGARGDWTAEVEGRRLAVIHSCWRQGATGYHDPMSGANITGKRYDDFLDALKSHDLVVVQRDVPGSFARDGYVGVFRFKGLEIGPKGEISLTLVERYADHK